MDNSLEEEILHLYEEPMIGATYTNTYGEENIQNLVGKYRSLNEPGKMLEILIRFSQSTDLATCFISVGVLHALGKNEYVQKAYSWAETQEDSARIISHFDIGKSVADYFTSA
ncbi:MAG: hypothetical protein HN472_16210 [Nitrospina sp.]|jgi:hypothetical protein|nr:hypothetical protein [Nitrospina sp.]MBT3511073.1 hypothetical protein [Nitrospina sp.]MBT3875563.1 hypothetical protein [Nitrospina sp.]MBT4047146.1 hypothetical protein [Nitrospina sp.]MBT4557968.1 hypothetical protein [Nitrospina sp.]